MCISHRIDTKKKPSRRRRIKRPNEEIKLRENVCSAECVNKMHLLMCTYAQSTSRRMFYNISFSNKIKKKKKKISFCIIYFSFHSLRHFPCRSLWSFAFLERSPVDSDLFEYSIELCRPVVCSMSMNERMKKTQLHFRLVCSPLTYTIVSSPIRNL